jgi:hypothetical protein
MEDMAVEFRGGKSYICLKVLHPGERNIGFNLVEDLKTVDVNDPVRGMMVTKKSRLTKIEALSMLSISIANTGRNRLSDIEAIFMYRSGLGNRQVVEERVRRVVERTSPIEEKSFSEAMHNIGKVNRPFDPGEEFTGRLKSMPKMVTVQYKLDVEKFVAPNVNEDRTLGENPANHE